MPKEIRGARRDPPEAGANHSDIEEWIHNQMPGLQGILTRLDETFRATIPGLEYAVKWKRAFYGVPAHGWIIELAPYAVSANVVFLGGADFSTRRPWERQAGRGTSK
jgi:hypothetical protein